MNLQELFIIIKCQLNAIKFSFFKKMAKSLIGINFNKKTNI